MEQLNVLELMELIENNIEYFNNIREMRTLSLNLGQLKCVTEKCVKAMEEINRFAYEYDFDETTPGNGYRSFVAMSELAVKEAFVVCKQLMENHGKLFFNFKSYAM